jgi:hypothetical protein
MAAARKKLSKVAENPNMVKFTVSHVDGGFLRRKDVSPL